MCGNAVGFLARIHPGPPPVRRSVSESAVSLECTHVHRNLCRSLGATYASVPLTTATQSTMSGATPAVPGSPPEALEQRTMHVFISRALHKILREAPKKHTQLRAACQEVIGAPTYP